jgi:flagellar protein FlbD
MIELTRLNGQKIFVNCDLIRYAEASPDTILTLVTGEKLVVLESYSAVNDLAFCYRVSLLKSAWPNAATALSAHAALTNN